MANYDIRDVQLVPMNKCRHLFVIQAELANIDKTDPAYQTNHIKQKYALRTDINKTMHLKVWRDGNHVFFDQLGENVAVPARLQHEENKFNDSCGSIYLGYNMDGDNVGDAYLIVGTGDFRNVAIGIDMKYWLLPGPAEEPVVIECTDNFKLWIHSNDPFQ
jgi:hypothetical protein